MFEGLKKSLSNLLEKLSKTELKEQQLDSILWDFKIALLENDVAVSVTDTLCANVKSTLQGVEVNRFTDKKKIVEETLKEVLYTLLKVEKQITLFDYASEKKTEDEPLVIVFVGVNGTGKCLDGDSLITLTNGRVKTIREIYNEAAFKGREKIIDEGFIVEKPGIHVYSINPKTLLIEAKEVTTAWKLKAPNQILTVTLINRSMIETTLEHPFFVLSTKGDIIQVRAQALQVGAYIMTPWKSHGSGTQSSKLPDEIPYLGSRIRKIRESLRLTREIVTRKLQIDPDRYSMYEIGEAFIPRKTLQEFTRIVADTPLSKDLQHLERLAFGDAAWLKVESIDNVVPPAYVYDLTVEDYHNFVANDLIVHNTTTIGKVAHRLLNGSYSVILAGSDTYRAGSIEQLDAHGKRLGIRVVKHAYGADAAAVAFDAITHARARGIDVVLIDTAGRMQTDRNLIDEMKKIIRVSKPDLVILVVDALTGNDAMEQGRVFNEAVGIDGVILTKLDADAKGGAAISIKYVTGKPILFLGTGQRYEDLTPFDPHYVVTNIFGE